MPEFSPWRLLPHQGALLIVDSMVNVWIKALDGRVIRSERVTLLVTVKVPHKGWTVLAELGRGQPAELAALGRGPRAKEGAVRLCNEWPQALAAAGKGTTITFVKAAYAKGDGQWSTLAASATPVRPIPVVRPDEMRERRRRPGQG